MIKICNQSDIESCEIDFKVRKIISNHLAEILTANDITDITELGAIYYATSLDSAQSLIDFCSIEWSVKIIVNDRNEQSIYYLCCYVVSNDIAIDVLIPKSVLDKESLNLVEETVNRRDYYYFC